MARSSPQWGALGVVVLGVFATTLDNWIVNVALPTIQSDLDLGLGGLPWVVNAGARGRSRACAPSPPLRRAS